MIVLWWLLPLAAYLLGSVSFAFWAGRLKGIDLRAHGSGNLGATNAGRVLGRGWFAAVFAADVLKGALPTLLAVMVEQIWFPHHPDLTSLAICTGAAAILGHTLPCWHGWRGGKAVATSLGVIAALVWFVAVVALAVWVVAWTIGRCCRLPADQAVGPASMVAAVAAPIAHLCSPFMKEPFKGLYLLLTLFVFAAAIVVLIKHRKNLRDLIARLRTPRSP